VPQLPFMRGLYLYHGSPHWWQFITHSFCHGSWNHLSMNLFNLCVFGKLVSSTCCAAAAPGTTPHRRHMHGRACQQGSGCAACSGPVRQIEPLAWSSPRCAQLDCLCPRPCPRWRRQRGALGCGSSTW
jgi:hypothetical protein